MALQKHTLDLGSCACSCKTGFSDPYILPLNYNHYIDIHLSAMFKKTSNTCHGEHPLYETKKEIELT